MKLDLVIGRRDVQRVLAFYDSHKHADHVRNRIAINVRKKRHPLSKDKIWHAVAACPLTSQQRSGPDSMVRRFSQIRPFPLAYKTCKTKRDLRAYAIGKLKAAGLRFVPRLSDQIAANFENLEDGLWKDLFRHLKELRDRRTARKEREVANFVDDELVGFGPKQSRNFLQQLGLTRYEVPLDSRLSKWMRNEMHWPFPVSADSLGNREYYLFVLDQFQKLCRAARIYPCLLDAAVFASFDEDAAATLLSS